MSDICNQPDILIKELFIEIISEWNNDDITVYTREKLIGIIMEHANEQARNEMNIVYRWMTQ